MKPLDQIGIECDTDKASFSHNYLQFYERFIGGWQDKELSILEIGIGDGCSLRMWEIYFPNAKIVAIDNDPSKIKWASDRSLIELGDQSDIGFLTTVKARYGPFDIVIDDGSHQAEDQISSLRALLPHVKNPGFYFLEDIIFERARDYIAEICGGVVDDHRPFTRGDDTIMRHCKFLAIMRGLLVIGT
jgi:predicted O-methyltransferase YrrM